jgi:transcriptional regulator with XRE-family HTH domain
MTEFGKNLDHLLGLHRVTQTRAAELLGVSRTTIANWISGSKEPNLSSLRALHEIFEIEPISFTSLPFVELLEDMLDVDRFMRVEARIYDEAQPGLTAGRMKIVPIRKDAS